MTSIFKINHCRVRARRSRQEIEWSWAKAKAPIERLSRLSVGELPLNDREILHVFAQRLTTYRDRLAMLKLLLTTEAPKMGHALGDDGRQSLRVEGLDFCPVTRDLESLPRSAQTLIRMHECVPYLLQQHDQLEKQAIAATDSQADAPQKVIVGPVEDFFARGREVARLADQGLPLTPQSIQSFEDPEDALNQAEVGLKQVLAGQVLSEEDLERLLADDAGLIPVVDARYDSQAGAWTAYSIELRGLVAEAGTFDELRQKITARLPELALENGYPEPAAYEFRIVVSHRVLPRVDTASAHITPAGGNVFEDLGFPPNEAANLQADSRARIAERWLQENSAAIESSNAYIETHGLPLGGIGTQPPQTGFASRVAAEARKLAGLVGATSDGELLEMAKTVDWSMVSSEFEAVVAKYARGVERYATRIIELVLLPQLSYQVGVEVQLALADMEDCLDDYDSAVIDAQVAAAWDAIAPDLAVRRGHLRALEPIRTLTALREACAETLALHARLDQGSQAYRNEFSLPYDAVDDVLRAGALSENDKTSILVASADRAWKKTSMVLVRAARALGLTVCDAVLGELASCIPSAVAEGLLETQGDLEQWLYSEIRLKARDGH